MQERFDNKLKGLLPPGARVLLAVSGGIDSMVLATLCLRSRINFSFKVVHCNFRLRGEESDGDEALVRSWCQEHRVPFIGVPFDTEAVAESNGISIEMAARMLRYSLFESLCRQEASDGVVLAHNANDNAETMVLNLLRGTGIRGLCGMREKSLIPVEEAGCFAFRPMLDFRRDEIEAFAKTENVPFREDRTNSDVKIKRNRIRHEVFPSFKEINPSFIDTFNRESRHFAQIRDIADSWYRDNVPGCTSVISGKTIIDISALTAGSNSAYMLYRILDENGFNCQDEVSALLQRRTRGENISGKVFLSEGKRLVLTNSSLIIASAQDSSASSLLPLERPGIYEIASSVVKVSGETWTPGTDPRQKDGTIVLDISKLPSGLVLRTWNDGDWMLPLGMGGRRKKLSDIFTDLHFSLPEKEAAVLLASGSEVYALLATRLDGSPISRSSEDAKVSSDTDKVLRISIL